MFCKLGWAAVIVCVFTTAGSRLRADEEKVSIANRETASQRALLDKYCVTCHNERAKTAGLSLEKVDIGRVGDSAEVWEKVVRKLRTGAMPPAGLPRPERASIDSLAGYLETALDRVAAARIRTREGRLFIA